MLGYAAMFEQFHPTDLLRWSRQAEDAGFGGIMASDHFHPWTPQQGQSAFVWAWMGALGAQTSRVRFGPGVTAPGYRYHPAILAQASATLAAMFPGRFYLGIGAGEALNEHIVGRYWPEAPQRLQLLEDAVEVIHKLFTGKVVKQHSAFFDVESARLYTLPDTPPPIYIATSGPVNSERTGRIAEGIITVGAPDEKIRTLLGRFEKGAREAGRDLSAMRRIIQLHVSWAESREAAVEQAVREWPNGGMAFPKGDIRSTDDFAAMAKLVRPEHFEGRVFMSADLGEHAAHIQHFIDLGFDDVYVHNVGRNQEAFIQAYARDVLPHLRWQPTQS
ncbi:MAG: Glucose-6-phosphate dehydrogenase (coenzyme F420) [Ktedonobacterales bacterium]|jgi:G6PDH family F420-dependent oxidoreductase|nr:MAG: Glucose-6-phosphate dehydrogenase (coenzyme F420) [Ktedonobacterales bacterium]